MLKSKKYRSRLVIHNNSPAKKERRHPDLNRGIGVLQTRALPLGYDAIYKNGAQRYSSSIGADDEARTRYLNLGKVALYQMSYIRKLVLPDGIEPSTRGFSVPCSTD